MCWNKPLKAKIQQFYDEWMASDEREFTTRNNPRAPSPEVYLTWIYEAWQSLSKEAISSSFKTCGISNAIDGSEDDLIHCFKENGQVPNGRQMLRAARATSEVEAVLEEEIDEDEDAENGYESDISIQC